MPSTPHARSILALPHVFIIPPEEEQLQTPPFCCFDADEPYHTDSDSDEDEGEVEHEHICLTDDNYHPEASSSTPIFHCPPLDDDDLQLRASNKMWKKRSPQAARSNPHIDIRERRRDLRDDPDVVEVIKVRRTQDRSALKNEPKMTRSATFKERASRAFKSFRNVGKAASHKPNTKEPLASLDDMLGAVEGVEGQPQGSTHAPALTAPPTSSLKRRASRPLSQLLHSATSDRKPPLSSQVIPSDTSSSLAYLQSSASSSTVSHPGNTEDEDSELPVSPSTSVKDSRKRFSMTEFHRMFSFSASHDEESTPLSSCAASSSISMTSCELDVPPEEAAYTSVCFIDVEDSICRHETRDSCSAFIRSSDHQDNGDIGFEMRLDSLHFDSLSFDPDEFDISTDGGSRIRC